MATTAKRAGLCWCLGRSHGAEQLADLRQQGRLPDAGGPETITMELGADSMMASSSRSLASTSKG